MLAALADTDPLGVPTDISFDSVGGLGSHIQQLKEMVSLPLLYPEVFERFKITPPRGVLFHGPPGTGKTLLARALAASCSTEGRKICEHSSPGAERDGRDADCCRLFTAFFMRKGADCLSKWVGEAERQLRLLFDEARACQPSIIFFDEIDGEPAKLSLCSNGHPQTDVPWTNRSCACPQQQAGADPCFDRLDPPRVDGRHGRPRTSHRHRCDESSGRD